LGERTYKEIHSKYKWMIAPGLIILACLLFFAKGIFLDRKTIIWDTADEFFPALWYMGRLWRNGLVPLWNPFIFNGYPIFADPQNQIFYLPNLIFLLVTNFSAKAVYLQLVLHFILAGTFMFLFAGFYVRNNLGRLLAALIFMFNGSMINHFQFLTIIDSVAYLPLILYFLEKGWRNQNVLYFMPAGTAVALMILAGHPQTSLFILYIVLAFTLFKLLLPGDGKHFSLFPAKLTVISVFLGLVLAAVQLIPSYEFSGLANRSGPLPYWKAVLSSGQFYPAHLITFFMPDYFGTVRGPFVGFGDIAHSSIYCGIVFVVVLYYTFRKMNRGIFFFWGMFLLTLLISMGDFGYIFRFIYRYMPGFDYFRSPVQYRFGVAFFAAILTGIGIDRIVDRKPVNKKIRRLYWGIVMLLVAAAEVLAVAVHLKGGGLSRVYPDLLIFVTFFVLFSFVLLKWEEKKISYTLFQVSLLLITFADFYVNGADATTVGSKTRHDAWEKEPQAVAAVKNRIMESEKRNEASFPSHCGLEDSLYRVYVDDGRSIHTEMLPYLPYDFMKLGVVGFDRIILHKVFLVDGYNPMMLKRYLFFNTIFRDKDYRKFLMLSDVKYIIRTDGSIETLPDEAVLPRAFLVSGVEVETRQDSLLEKLSEPSFDVREKALIEKPASFTNENACGDGKGEAHIISYKAGDIRVSVTGKCSSFLVLSDMYYPGWEVSIDGGRNVAADRADYCFMGTVVPAGRHEVSFVFEPDSIRLGLLISACGILSILIISAMVVLRKRRQARGG
jgi:Bacterial membrane protein YfhO